MKINIDRSVLLRALTHANSVVEKRTTIPILSNVMLHADSGRLTLTATDLDIQITEHVVAEVEQAGSTTVASGTLTDIVRKLPDGSRVQIAVEGSQLIITAGRSRFKLNVLPVDDFPVIASGDLPDQIDITASQLSEMIDDTRFAMSGDETRYYLNGIYFHVEDKMLKAVATDGHRLALSAVAYEGQNVNGIIVPRKTVAEVRKLLSEVDGVLQVHLSNAKIRFDLGEVTLTSKLVDGTFPDYTRVIPKSNDKVMLTDVSSLKVAAERVSIVSSDKTRALTMNVRHTAVELSVVSPENGTATDEISAECQNELRIGFNARYLQDILSQVSTDQVEFHFGDESSPVLIKQKEAANDDREKTFILMPMRV
ncbi:DNA polymerase III subunit beta [Sphingomonas sp. 3-13AW]|uniref:DNA polymerase III subunit beta n=1 Tax=Sphingomonas sp. 3-13AW TaxID=3050450 RepID=UPI003BB6AD7A